MFCLKFHLVTHMTEFNTKFKRNVEIEKIKKGKKNRKIRKLETGQIKIYRCVESSLRSVFSDKRNIPDITLSMSNNFIVNVDGISRYSLALRFLRKTSNRRRHFSMKREFTCDKLLFHVQPGIIIKNWLGPNQSFETHELSIRFQYNVTMVHFSFFFHGQLKLHYS